MPLCSSPMWAIATSMAYIPAGLALGHLVYRLDCSDCPCAQLGEKQSGRAAEQEVLLRTGREFLLCSISCCIKALKQSKTQKHHQTVGCGNKSVQGSSQATTLLRRCLGLTPTHRPNARQIRCALSPHQEAIRVEIVLNSPGKEFHNFRTATGKGLL